MDLTRVLFQSQSISIQYTNDQYSVKATKAIKPGELISLSKYCLEPMYSYLALSILANHSLILFIPEPSMTKRWIQ